MTGASLAKRVGKWPKKSNSVRSLGNWPEVSDEPMYAPAEVPTTISATFRSTPFSSRPWKKPQYQAT